MKVWMVYKKIPCLSPMLYGFTNEKEIIKLFKKQYNLSRFNIIEHDIDKKIWYQLNTKYPNNIMRVRGLKTLNSQNHASTVDIVMTERDDMQLFLESDKILDYLASPVKTIRDYSHLLRSSVLNSVGILWSRKIDWKDIKVDMLSLYILMNEDYMVGNEINKEDLL